jgi:TIR domain
VHSIFVSYRRDDAEGEAGRLADDLTEIFHENSVFMDVNAIQPGRDFRKAIDESIHQCSVLLAILGPGWLDSTDAAGRRRLDDETDYLRLEVASALQRDIPVIPVLVRGAKMPRAEQLSSDLVELAYRNAVELTHARWKSDVQVLVRSLRPYLEPTPHKAVAPETITTGFEAAALAGISHELAAYIGPIAEIVVKRAARRSSSMEDLCATVAQEIESKSDRARFLLSCRSKSR